MTSVALTVMVSSAWVPLTVKWSLPPARFKVNAPMPRR